MSSKGFLTAKAIGNRIKAKGLQKLRWYCQMCEKQCRDENGFKCHCLSETHTRQMALFRDDPSKFMDQYSRDFEGYFMAVMKRKGGMRVRANTVYQEVVADRTHIHMNSTKWETLGTFVQYLGKTGLCRVDQTEKGWYVQYIDRDPRFLARQEEIAKRAEQSMDEEERASERIQKQIEEATKAEEAAKHALMEAAAAAGGTGEAADEEHKAAIAHTLFDHAQPTEIHERGEEEKIVFSLSAPHISHGAATAAVPAAAAAASSAASTAASSSSLAASSSSAAVPAASSSAPASSSSSSAAAAAVTAPPAASSTPFMKPAAPFTMSFARPSMLSAFGGGGGGSADSGESSASSKRKAPAPSHTSSTLSALMAENERIKVQEQAAKKLKADAAPPKPAAAAASSSSSAAAGAGSSSKRLDYWLFPNLIVKVLNKKLLGGSLYKQKGVVLRVHDKYVAELRLLAGGPGAAAEGTVLRIDQDELESVIPAVGKVVQVVNGTYRGEIAVLLDLNEAKYTAKLRIESGVLRGKEVEGIEYEDICKLNEA